MNEGRKFLPTGTKIITANGVCYRIQRVVGGGGSAVVYGASKDNSWRQFVLKECYPVSKIYNFVRDGGSVRLEYPDDENAADFFNSVKENILHENEIGQIISTKTGRAVASWEKLEVSKIIIDEKTFDASESLFIVMEQVTDENKQRGWFLKDLLNECAEEPAKNAPLRNGGEPSPYVSTRIIEEILKALRDIHNAGYIHGDLNDVNFFLLGQDLKRGDIGVGQLLDFGNSKEILADGKTATIKKIFSTPGYTAPELLQIEHGEVRLTAALDIYFVGCIMMYLFYGMTFKEACGEDSADFEENIPSAWAVIQRGYRKGSEKLFTDILKKSLATYPEQRYQNGDEMLTDILELKEMVAPPKFLLAQNLSRCDYFVEGSRDREIEILQQEMDAGKNPLYIYGIGGVGKTEVAMEFARRQIQNGVPAYFSIFHGSIKETVCHLDFSGYEFEVSDNESFERDYKTRLEILRENYKGCLLIVDNFDDPEKNLSQLQSESAYKDLVKISGLTILFTTRSKPDEMTKELATFDEKTAFKLFNSISPVEAKDYQIVNEILREVNFHPLTVEILAKNIEESWRTISYKDLLARLRYGLINNDNLPTVSVKKNSLNDLEVKVYRHLVTIFNLYNLGESYRKVLCHATLLPSEGFDAATFIRHEDAENILKLKKIENHSWIRRRKETNVLWIHPLIRSVIKNELVPSDEDCTDFLYTLWNFLDNMYPQELKLFHQAAELFNNAAGELQDTRGNFSFYAGFCYMVAGNYVKAYFHENKALSIHKKFFANNPQALARTYNDAGVAHLHTCDFDKAMEYFEKAIKILSDSADAENLRNLANVFANVSGAYLERENFEKALSFAKKAVEIFEKHKIENLGEKANAHNTFAQALKSVKKYNESLLQLKTAVEILEKIAPEYLHLAILYRNIADVYALTGNNEKALPFAQKALKIFENNLPSNHSEIMATFGFMADLYKCSGDTEKYNYYSQKFNEILNENKKNSARKRLKLTLQILDAEFVKKDKKNLVKYNRDAAECCQTLNQSANAQKFILDSVKNIDDATDLNEKYFTYFSASQIFAAQKKFKEAIDFAEKSLATALKWPQNLNILTTPYFHLGGLYSTVGKHEAALENFRAAVNAQLQLPLPEISFVLLIKRAAARELLALGKFEDAEKIFAESLAEQLKFLPEFHSDVQLTKKFLKFAREKSLMNSETGR